MAKLEETTEASSRVERAKALAAAVAGIEKTFGKGAVMRLGERASEPVAVIPTGARPLDRALGIGGLPRGRIVEVFGPEASGKTTLALHVVAEAQRAGGVAAFIDAEHALDPAYAARLGVDLDNLLVSQPDCGEQGLEIADTLAKTGHVDLIVVDSVAALVTRVEIEGEMGAQHVGLQARLMSQALRKLTATLSRTKTIALFINQLREKIATGPFARGETTTTPGGRALKFYASVRLDVRGIGQLKRGEEVVGRRVKVKVAKNKHAPPFRTAEFDVHFGEGISREACLLDDALEAGVLRQKGTWLMLGEESIGQGRDAARATLKERPDLYAAIEKRLVEAEEEERRAEAARAAEKAAAGAAAGGAAANGAADGTRSGGDAGRAAARHEGRRFGATRALKAAA